MRASTICSGPGCPLAATNAGHYEAHHLEARRERDERRPSAAARGYDARWRRTRAAMLRARPWCQECGARAQHVHHVDERGPLGPRGHSPGNLECLCDRCHNAWTARRQNAPPEQGEPPRGATPNGSSSGPRPQRPTNPHGIEEGP